MDFSRTLQNTCLYSVLADVEVEQKNVQLLLVPYEEGALHNSNNSGRGISRPERDTLTRSNAFP